MSKVIVLAAGFAPARDFPVKGSGPVAPKATAFASFATPAREKMERTGVEPVGLGCRALFRQACAPHQSKADSASVYIGRSTYRPAYSALKAERGPGFQPERYPFEFLESDDAVISFVRRYRPSGPFSYISLAVSRTTRAEECPIPALPAISVIESPLPSGRFPNNSKILRAFSPFFRRDPRSPGLRALAADSSFPSSMGIWSSRLRILAVKSKCSALRRVRSAFALSRRARSVSESTWIWLLAATVSGIRAKCRDRVNGVFWHYSIMTPTMSHGELAWC